VNRLKTKLKQHA